jgi:hypothetical protein
MNSDELWGDVIKWFGYQPNFHDAEVESIDLRRGAVPSIVRVHAWRTRESLDESGRFERDLHAIVSFTITGITRLELTDWNHQNVLAGLSVLATPEGYSLVLNGNYGVDGVIIAQKVKIGIEPWQQGRAV